MADLIKKEDLKKALTEALEPFADSIKGDFNRVDERFNQVDERFERIDERFEGVDRRLQNISTTVANLEVDMKEIKPEIKETREIMNNLFNRIDKFLLKLETLDQEFTIIKEDIRRVKEVIKEKLGVDLT